MRDLHQDAGAIAEARVGADRAAMFEIAENAERIGDDLVRLLALDVGDEADAAGILFQARVVKAVGLRAPSMQFALCSSRAASVDLASAAADSAWPRMCSRSNSDPLMVLPLNSTVVP